MSKKDYQAIARAINQSHREANQIVTGVSPKELAHWALDNITGKLSDIFKADNSQFDRSRFLEACETGTTKGMAR